MSERRFWIAVALLTALLATVQVVSMLGETQTWDEGIHLAAGYGYLTTGDYAFNPEHPALGKMLCALPLLPLHLVYKREWANAPEQPAGIEFLYANRASPELILGMARSVTVLLTALFSLWIAWWTKTRFGSIAALIALALFSLDPNIIAHGHYVTTDLVASFFVFLGCTLWLDWLATSSRVHLVLAGLSLGCALSSKYSALFLVPLFLVSGLVARRWRETLIALVLALAVVAAVYFPEVLNRRHLDRLTGHLTGTGATGELLVWASRKFRLHAWIYLIGLDRLSEHNQVGHQSYLLGKFSDYGWWYYFPVAFLVKTPVATICAIGSAAALLWKTNAPRLYVFGLAFVAVAFTGFCLTSRINIGYRHMMPALAFLFVLAGVALQRYPRVAAGLVLLLAVESFAIYPHYLSFFNFASGGPKAGPKYLLDSNIDWGQDIKYLGAYMKEHKIPSICLYFFGNVDWGRYGVQAIDFPEKNPMDCDGWGAVSVTPLFGLYAPRDYFATLRQRPPTDRVGYSIYMYDLRKKK